MIVKYVLKIDKYCDGHFDGSVSGEEEHEIDDNRWDQDGEISDLFSKALATLLTAYEENCGVLDREYRKRERTAG